MSRKEAIPHRRRAMWATAAAVVLLAGCASEQPRSDEAQDATDHLVAPATLSHCAETVTLEWANQPQSQSRFTAVQVVRVRADGTTDVRYEFDRDDSVGLVERMKITDTERAMIDDAVAGGLADAAPAPRFGADGSHLEGLEPGVHVAYAYARHVQQDGVLRCDDDTGTGAAVEVRHVTFEEVESAVLACDGEGQSMGVASVAAEYCDRA